MTRRTTAFHQRMKDRYPRAARLTGVLAAASIAYIVGTLIFYPYFMRRQFFMVWNLFLAVLPLAFSWAVLSVEALPKTPARSLLLWAAGLLWLFFYPNSPYMITDLLHITQYSFYGGGGPYRFNSETGQWLGMLHLAAGTALGCASGGLSLYLLHGAVRNRLGRGMGWLFVAAVSLLCGPAIFVGRFLRFNSWDIATRPLRLVAAVLAEVGPTFLTLSLVFAVLSFCVYGLFYAVYRPAKGCSGAERN